ncbi:RING-H2 finger protein ATL43 [Cardamine amara subsp. amara]|uniref:RING-type E3 ubiquitin transferase n=1 Tax=Cardamine amara subsp. amara TaxID=228776 RepID=A0ABD0ZQW3_CARAN
MSSSLLLLFSLLSFSLNVSLADNHTAVVITNLATPPPLPPPSPPPQHNFTSSLMPGIAVVIAVLTAVFSLTFLLLLYVKHCKQRNGNVYVNHPQRFAISRYGGGYYSGGGGVGGGRKNSGIDRSVIESLPVFRFGALSGQKDGLECAVCLARFEPTEVLRLLPKCKHAFHVECVDTWLDAHSTCPLCRYRVDPEDILLIGDCNSWFELRFQEESNSNHPGSTRFDRVSRISGRHSSAGEEASRLKEIRTSSSSSKSNPMSFRRSLDSSLKINDGREVKSESVSVNCLDRLQRKDGLLLIPNRESVEGRFEHRIIISGGNRDQRWSEVRPSDLLYLRSEMILSDCRKLAAAEDRRDVINGRSVSELTSIERRRRWGGEPRQRQATAVISRWLAWSHRASASSVV